MQMKTVTVLSILPLALCVQAVMAQSGHQENQNWYRPATTKGQNHVPVAYNICNGRMPCSSPVVDTSQDICYDDGVVIACPIEGEAFYGQDAQHSGRKPSYTDNGDGTVTDNVTGLMWQQSPDSDGDGDIDVAG